MTSYADRLERFRLAGDPDYKAMVHAMLRVGRAMPLVSDDPHRQAFYNAMRLDAAPHALAEMLALQRPPMSNTDREFLEGHCNGSQFSNEEWVGDLYHKQAREAGVDPKGKVYMAGLARFPGDPEAWVGGRGDVQRVCETRGWGCEGSVSVTPRERDTNQKRGAVAEDIVRREMAQALEAVPPAERAYVDTEDLREQIVEARKPHWSE
jgi:hypothetical protein